MCCVATPTQLCHGWAMGASNSHEMPVRQARTPDELQARTNTTLRSLNRAVIFGTSVLMLALNPTWA